MKKKEYEMILTISEGYSNRYAKTLDFIVSAINNKNYDVLDLESVKMKMDEVFEAITLKVRFDSLLDLNSSIICNKDCFELDTHKFETLDEVEKAIKNKAFL